MSVRSFDSFPIPLWINMAARARVRQRANDSGVTVQSIHLQTDRRTDRQTDRQTVPYSLSPLLGARGGPRLLLLLFVALLSSSPLLAAPSTAFALLLAGFLTRRPLKQSLLLLLRPLILSRPIPTTDRPTAPHRCCRRRRAAAGGDRQTERRGRASSLSFPPGSLLHRAPPSIASIPLPSLVGRTTEPMRPSVRLSDPDAQESARERARPSHAPLCQFKSWRLHPTPPKKTPPVELPPPSPSPSLCPPPLYSSSPPFCLHSQNLFPLSFSFPNDGLKTDLPSSQPSPPPPTVFILPNKRTGWR